MMNEKMHELRDDLQILALPVSFQMRLDVGTGCRARALSRPLISWTHCNAQRLSSWLTSEQIHALSTLSRAVKYLPGLPNCSDATLRQSKDWRQVRQLARVALLNFGWNLELPAHEASIYMRVKGEVADEQLT